MNLDSQVLVESLRAFIFAAVIVSLGVVIFRASKAFLGPRYPKLGARRFRIAGTIAASALALIVLRTPATYALGGINWLVEGIAPALPSGYSLMLLNGLYQTAIALALLLLMIQAVGEFYWFFESKLSVLRLQESTNDRRQVIRGSVIWDGLSILNRLFRTISFALLLLAFMSVFLQFFPRTQLWVDAGKEAFGGPLTGVLRSVLDYFPNLAALLVILAFGWLFLRLMRYVFRSIGRGTLEVGDFPQEWAEPTYRLLRTLYFIFLLMVSYPYLPGASSQFFQGFSVFVGALVTLGSAGAIGNLVAGTVLTYTKSFRVGDLVKIGGNTGIIVEKSLLVTRMRSALNEEITIPNSSVLASDVKNYISAAERTGLALTVQAGIGYDVDWRTVHRLMIEAALKTSGIANEPAPLVLNTGLGDYAVTYELRAWTHEAHRMIPVASELRANVLDCFNAAGVEIMTPSVQALRDASRLAIPAERVAVPSNPNPLMPIRIDFWQRHSESCEGQSHPGRDSAS